MAGDGAAAGGARPLGKQVLSVAAGYADSAQVLHSFAGRLRVAVGVLLATEPPSVPDDSAQDASIVLDALIASVRHDLSPARMWLLYLAVTGCYPSADTVQEGLREFQLSDPIDCALWLLDCAASRDVDRVGRRLELVRDGILVDVHHTAQQDLHTGIQQVIRQTMPFWNKRDNALVFAAWTPDMTVLRELDAGELGRVLSWPAQASPGPAGLRARAQDEAPVAPVIYAPWNTTVVLPEVSSGEAASRLAAMARYSNNRLSLIGYDCIPVVSADMVPELDSTKFVRYLEVVKHADRVAAISASAAVEFAGFVKALPAQGLRGPQVVECRLASEREPIVRHRESSQARPLVLMVGSFEPRKNHLAVLQAAETLWREGLDFTLGLIGGSGWGHEIPERIESLQAAGRPVTVGHRVSQDVVDDAYLDARFTVFPSLHEGYGLPIAESLAAGTPAIISDFGSMAELGELGGTVMIDPHDDLALIEAMRRLLLDDAELGRLKDEIARRAIRTWQDYADDLWWALIEQHAGSTSTRAGE
jgi:glycosyltransferase involved in cell wall biosynthesis